MGRWRKIGEILLVLIMYPLYFVLGLVNLVGMAFFAVTDPQPGRTYEEWVAGEYVD